MDVKVGKAALVGRSGELDGDLRHTAAGSVGREKSLAIPAFPKPGISDVPGQVFEVVLGERAVAKLVVPVANDLPDRSRDSRGQSLRPL
jgi:hypothetical protein